MATIGRNKAVADLNFVRFGGFLAWVMWAGVHIVLSRRASATGSR